MSVLVAPQRPTAAAPPRASWSAVALAAAFRWACFAVMTVLAVWNERRGGVRIADPILDRVPFVPAIERWNYHLWIVAWLPWLFVVLARDRARFVRLMIGCGVLSLLRGVCIVATGLGPVRGDDVNARLDWTPELFARVVGDILNPLAVFMDSSANVWLTKDLFFSGHTASTFFLLLHVWRWPRVRNVVLVLHVAVVASLLLGHIHYAIDVVGAWVAAAAVYAILERAGTSAPRAGHGPVDIVHEGASIVADVGATVTKRRRPAADDCRGTPSCGPFDRAASPPGAPPHCSK